MRPVRRPRVAHGAALALVAGLVLSGCSSSMTAIEREAGTPSPTSSATSSAATTAKVPDCGNPQQSYDPLTPLPGAGGLPGGSYEAAIRKRGRLVVGVSADTMLFGFRNPFDGQIVGFDIDMVHAVAQAILGDASKVEFRVITAAQRIPVLQKSVDQGGVDLVARAMTVNCARWSQVSFSSVYYLAHLKVLVPLASRASGLAALKGQRVCAPKGSTTLDSLKKYPVTAVGAGVHTDCLALFQEGKVDAIAGDDAILAGFVAQDRYAKVIGAPLSDEPYGLAMSKTHPEFVRFVNAVLDRMRSDGQWQRAYDSWLKPALGVSTAPPVLYGRRA